MGNTLVNVHKEEDGVAIYPSDYIRQYLCEQAGMDGNASIVLTDCNGGSIEVVPYDGDPAKVRVLLTPLEAPGRASRKRPADDEDSAAKKQRSDGQAPDDAVKVFLGPIPRDLDEASIMQMFEKFGRIYEVFVIRDKTTRQSKGCAFVTYLDRDDADKCIAEMNGKQLFSNVSAPLQAKYADGERERLDNDVFIGNIPIGTTEEQIREILAPFGKVRAYKEGKSSDSKRTYCFISMNTRQQAMNAIRALNNRYQFPGESLTMTVKFSNRENRGMPGMGMPGGMPGMPQQMPYGYAQQYPAPGYQWQGYAQQPQAAYYPYQGAAPAPAAGYPGYGQQQYQGAAQQQQQQAAAGTTAYSAAPGTGRQPN